MHDLNKIKANFALFFVAVIWGSTFVLVKKAIEIAPPFSFLFFRFLLAFLLTIPLFYLFKAKINKKTLINGFLMGFCLFLAFAFQTFGLKYVEASIVAFITGLYVVISPVLSFLLLKKKIPVTYILSIFLSVLGLSLLTLKGGIKISKGQILVLICAILYSIHIIMTDYYTRLYPATSLTLIQLGVVSFFSFPLTLIYHKNFFINKINFEFLLALFITSIFATVLAFLVMMKYQKYTNPTKASLIYAAEIVAAAIFSYVFAGEILTFKDYLGGILIIFSILIAKEIK